MARGESQRIFLCSGKDGEKRDQWKYHGERLETLDNIIIIVVITCLEGNTHRHADVGNRGQAQRSPR